MIIEGYKLETEECANGTRLTVISPLGQEIWSSKVIGCFITIARHIISDDKEYWRNLPVL